MSNASHLLQLNEREARVQEKQDLVLQFLTDEIWTDVSNVGELLQINRAATYRTLNTLERKQLIRSARISCIGSVVTLWGITAHGQGLAATDQTPVRKKIFAPSKVAPTFVRHTLDLQLLRIKSQQQGWTGWINADRIQKWTAGLVRPDAFVTSVEGLRVAVECERTIKSPKRYSDILSGWLQVIRKGDVSYVVWVSPNEHIRSRLQHIITSITHVPVNGQLVLIPRDRFDSIKFNTYEEWPLL